LIDGAFVMSGAVRLSRLSQPVTVVTVDVTSCPRRRKPSALLQCSRAVNAVTTATDAEIVWHPDVRVADRVPAGVVASARKTSTEQPPQQVEVAAAAAACHCLFYAPLRGREARRGGVAVPDSNRFL